MNPRLSKGTGKMVWGIILLVLFGAASISLFTEEPRNTGAAVLGVAIALLGLRMWFSGRASRKVYRLFPDYAKRMSAQRDCTVSSLAASMGRTPEQTRAGLLYLYRKRCFPQAYEDKSRACLVFPYNPRLLVSVDPGRQRELDLEAASAAPVSVTHGSGATGSAPTVAVTCPGCGAANRIAAGSAGECEYCGAAIEAKK